MSAIPVLAVSKAERFSCKFKETPLFVHVMFLLLLLLFDRLTYEKKLTLKTMFFMYYTWQIEGIQMISDLFL